MGVTESPLTASRRKTEAIAPRDASPQRPLREISVGNNDNCGRYGLVMRGTGMRVVKIKNNRVDRETGESVVDVSFQRQKKSGGYYADEMSYNQTVLSKELVRRFDLADGRSLPEEIELDMSTHAPWS